MADQMIRAALTNLEHKYIPQKTATDVYVPQEAYRSLFDLLDVYGNDRDNAELQTKTKYIWEKLSANKQDVKQQLLDIINTLGVIPVGDTRINRIWKYINLMENAGRVKKYHDTLISELEQLKQKEEAEK